jgi:hypothetical protein
VYNRNCRVRYYSWYYDPFIRVTSFNSNVMLLTVFSSPGHVSYCHQFSSVVCRPSVNILHFNLLLRNTGTCFIQKIYAPSSSLLQGKHLSCSSCPLRLNIFAYLWSFRWPNYGVKLPRYFSFRLPHLNIPTPQTNWTRIFSERRIFYFYVIETDTATSSLRWIFHMHSEFSRMAMCNDAIMIISSQM